MTRIGDPADHKENMYNNEVRKNKVGGGRHQDLGRRKMKLLAFG